MRKQAVTLTRPERHSPIMREDTSRLPIRKGTKIPQPYVFVHWDQWEYDDTHGWIPLLAKIIAQPGVNGVPTGGSLTSTLSVVASKGGNIIDPNDVRLVEKGETKETSEWYQYPRYFLTQGANPQKYWVEPGMEPTINGNRVLWDKKKIGETSARFRAHLRDSGMVQPMHRLTLDSELALERARVERMAGRVGMNPHLKAELKRREDRLVAMEEAFHAKAESDMKTGTKIKPTRSKRKITSEVADG